MFKKVLVPIRGGDGGEEIGHKIVNKAREVCDGELVLLHVPTPIPQTVGGENREELQSERKSDAAHVLAPFARELQSAGVPFHTRIVPGTVAEVIVQIADEEKADLIVMFTDGEDNLGDLFLGTITERVLRDTGTDLLAIRDKKNC